MRTEIHKKIKNHRGKCLNLYHWQCAFQRKQLFAARKSSENSLLSLWRTLLCRGSFQQTELRGPGDPPWIVRTKENPKTFKKGGFLCNKDIFLKQYRGLVSWAWNLWQFFLHQDVHHLLVTFPASDVAMRIANFPRGSRIVVEAGRKKHPIVSHKLNAEDGWKWWHVQHQETSGRWFSGTEK